MKVQHLLITLLAALFITSCCNTEIIDETNQDANEGLQKISLNVKAQADADTRLSVDDLSSYWRVKWSLNETLLGYSYNETTAQQSKFDIDNNTLTDGKEALFTGITLPNSMLRLFYPNTGNTVKKDLLEIDLSIQHSNSTATTSTTEKMFMLSDPIAIVEGEASKLSPTMKHLTTQLRVAMRFGNVPTDAHLSHIVLYNITNSAYSHVPIRANLNLKSGDISSVVNGEMIVIDDHKTAIAAGTELKLHASSLPFSVAAGDKINLVVYFTVGDKNFRKSFEIRNTSTSTMKFESGKFHELRKMCDLSNATSYLMGKGTADEPFLIRNRAELERLQTAGVHTPRYHFKVANSFSLGNTEWKPIPTFSHHLDGGNFTISDLKITNPTAANQALFGNLTLGATISNLHVTGSVTGNNQTAGIVGGNSGVISGCSFSGEVSGNNNVGGICGMHHKGTIINCFNKGSIRGVKRENPTGSTACYVGGICGYAYEMVQNCYNLGKVDAGYSPGGIVGSGYGCTVSNCYNYGTITGGSAGAIIGYFTGTLTHCYFLLGSAKEGIGSGSTSTSLYSQSADQMRTLATTLNVNALNIKGAYQWEDTTTSPVFKNK